MITNQHFLYEQKMIAVDLITFYHYSSLHLFDRSVLQLNETEIR